MVGKTFGVVRVIKNAIHTSLKRKAFLVICTRCGIEKIMMGGHIRRCAGTSTGGCRCNRGRKPKENCLTNHGAYRILAGMKIRCYSKKHMAYHRYGGRGIKVCDEWIKDARTFLDFADAKGWEKGLQIDRIDNDGDYTPENCRFVTPKVNSNNKMNNRILNINGEKLNVSQCAERYNIPHDTITSRLNKGWSGVESVELVKYARYKDRI